MEEEIARIGVSLPKNLLDEFDRVIAIRGYSSRSEAIRDAIRAYLLEYKWLEKEQGTVVGAVSLVYDHTAKGINDAIVETQHEFCSYINATVHLHLGSEQCLEIILVKGDIAEIRKLIDKLTSLRGVLNVKFVTASRI